MEEGVFNTFACISLKTKKNQVHQSFIVYGLEDSAKNLSNNTNP